MAKSRHDKDFDLARQWALFLERCNLPEALREDQEREMRKAFYGAAGQIILLLRDDVAALSMADGVQVMKRLLSQVEEFFVKEVREHNASVGRFQATDRARWEQDVLEDDIFTGAEVPVRLIRKPDDAECTRVSTGGDKPGVPGVYVTYRGDLASVERVLKNGLKAVTHMLIQKNSGLS